MSESSEPVLDLRVRPVWLRGRVIVALVALVVGTSLAVLHGVAPEIPRSEPAMVQVERLQACATASREHAVRFCLPSPGDAARAAASRRFLSSVEPPPAETADPGARQALVDWQTHRRAQDYLRLTAEVARLSTDGGDEVAVYQEALAAVARAVALEDLPAAKRAQDQSETLAGRARFAGGLALVSLSGMLRSMWALLPGLILVPYGLASLWMAARRFHVRLRRHHLAVGPPTGVERYALGDLHEVTLEDGRLVLVRGRGRAVRTPRMQVSSRLRELVEAANRAIADAEGDSRVRVEHAPDAVRLEQGVPGWLRWGGSASVVLGALGLVALLVGLGGMYTLDHALAEAPAVQSAVEACGGGRSSYRCLRLEPAILDGVPRPGTYRRLVVREATREVIELGKPGPYTHPVGARLGTDGRAEDWLQTLREGDERWRSWSLDVVTLGGTEGQAIEARADAQASALQALFTQAWSDPGVQAAWERAVRRDAQLRRGIPWLWLQDHAPGAVLLLGIALLFLLVPPWLRRRSTVHVEVTATGVELAGQRVPFAEIASIELEGRRLVVRTRDGARLRTGRLVSPATAAPILEAVRSRILDESDRRQEEEERERAHQALAAARERQGG